MRAVGRRDRRGGERGRGKNFEFPSLSSAYEIRRERTHEREGEKDGGQGEVGLADEIVLM